jgi:ABC-type transporter Mla MlaB component
VRVTDPEPAIGAERARPARPAVLVIRGPVRPDAVAGLCAHVRALLQDPAVPLVTCDFSGVARPDAVTLEAIARMQLTARRMGRSIRLSRSCPELRALLALAGLTDVVPGDEVTPP